MSVVNPMEAGTGVEALRGSGSGAFRRLREAIGRDQAVQVLRWAWRWRVVLLMNVYLIAPVLFYEVRLRDKTMPFTLSASVLGLATVHLLVRRVWLLHAVLFPFYVLVGVDLYTILHYDTRLASNMIVTIVENMGDATAFLQGDMLRTVGNLLLLFVAYGFCLWSIRDKRMTVPRWLAIGPFTGLVLVYAGVTAYTTSWMTTILNDRSSPFGIFSQSYLALDLHRQELLEREQAKSFRFGAVRAAPPSEAETYVLVIGESARKHNFSLYGYERDTNPRLSKLRNLVVFEDVITQVAQTRLSVPLLITRGTAVDRSRSARERSILAAFQEVGFHTAWLSTQQRETAMASISRYTSDAEVVRFFERQHDMLLASTLANLLAQGGERDKRIFLLHTQGSHFNLTSRYPRSFARYPDGEGTGVLAHNSATEGRRELIGAYDNTVLYTDHVLAEIIASLERQPGIKALVYVPDHGDNLRDDDRNLFGHAHSNEWDLPIPMLFWYSNEFEQRYPEKVQNARKNAAHKLTTRSVFYTLADIGGISLADPELPKLSVLSAELANYPRIVSKEPHPVDFDEWMAENGITIPKAVPPP